MARGGRRTGKPGSAYPNRVDLPGKPLAPTAATGQPYGAAGAQLAAQQTVPMAAPPPPQAPGAAPGPGPSPPQGPLPGSAGAFNRPTDRPFEPVTAGLASGPGAGPEAVPGLAAGAQDRTVGDLLNRLAAAPGASANVRAMADMVNAGQG